jgi:hypothetical protein
VDTVGFSTKFNESELLYGVSGLAHGLPHTLQIVNAPLDPQRPWLRIDKFVVESGGEGGNIMTVINDSASSIHYTRRWSKESEGQSAYLGRTLQ